MGTLYVATLLYPEPFNGYSLVLMVLGDLISSGSAPSCAAARSMNCRSSSMLQGRMSIVGPRPHPVRPQLPAQLVAVARPVDHLEDRQGRDGASKRALKSSR
jgi:hypothetical protein